MTNGIICKQDLVKISKKILVKDSFSGKEYENATLHR